MNDNIYDFYGKQPHCVAEVMCINCKNRWIGVFPQIVLLKEIFCDYCEKTGYIIKTGQELEE